MDNSEVLRVTITLDLSAAQAEALTAGWAIFSAVMRGQFDLVTKPEDWPVLGSIAKYVALDEAEVEDLTNKLSHVVAEVCPEIELGEPPDD